ncbi:MAG: hypothetical protein HY984_01015 [Candidatus Magasanikbacteria bacterium]|nr:hypothetical protein [Candidatus Magasanikbacteria bacterium]
MTWFKAHHELAAHHRYQLEVIFLFIIGFFLFFPYYLLLEEYGLDPLDWQWFFFWPWIAFYAWYSLRTRGRITRRERQDPLKRPIGHWVLLGISLIVIHLQPSTLAQLQSIDWAFAVFSIFLADSYWDFRNLKK